MKKCVKFFSINHENDFWIRKFVQLFRILHIKQQSHIIFNYLIKVVKQNERNLKLKKLQKSIHYRNSFEIWKIMLKICLRNNISRCFQRNDTIFITIQCAFARFWTLLIVWIKFTLHFKMNFRLYILLIECKCY